jgi:hypothetical protein
MAKFISRKEKIQFVADIGTTYKVFNTQQRRIIRDKCAIMGEQTRHTKTLKRKENKTVVPSNVTQHMNSQSENSRFSKIKMVTLELNL